MTPINFLDYKINPSINELTINGKILMVNTINPHCYCEAKNDNFYKEALQNSDILIPDGTGIVWAIKLLTGYSIRRITGADLHQHLLCQVNQTCGKVFYMGSTISCLQKIEERINKEYPNIIVVGYSPPFRSHFSVEENIEIINIINSFKPDVVFVGMTAPKQEKWVYQNKKLLDTKVICSIGAVFDFYAGTIKRPGKFWQMLGLEWLPRLFREPQRLWRRNFVSTPLFIWDIVLTKIGLLKHK